MSVSWVTAVAPSASAQVAEHARCITRTSPTGHAALTDLLPQPTGGVSFVTDGAGLVGWGVHAEITLTGADAAARIEQWYREQVAALAVEDAVQCPGSGPVCFVSLGFSPADESVAVIPRIVVGSRGDEGFMTITTRADSAQRAPDGSAPAAGAVAAGAVAAEWPAERSADGSASPATIRGEREPVTAPGQVSYADAELSTTGFISAVETAIARIQRGEAAKVVLAHGLTALTELPVDERLLLRRLAERYPSCSAFAVAGLIGASPEMLIRREGARISSRVLAGTAWPERLVDGGDLISPPSAGEQGPKATGEAAVVGAGAASGSPSDGAAGDTRGHGTAGDAVDAGATGDAVDAGATARMHRVAANLLTSAKDLAEHAFAVRSVAEVLGPLSRELTVPSAPAALELANLTHLATDVTGSLADGDGRPSALELAARLHPTAAVGGTPTEVAQAMIAELEPVARGRYAAPIGWFDARGDGEFAIALRCAQVAGRSVRMMAGCGIVADSDPLVEAREAQIKMLPIRDALEG